MKTILLFAVFLLAGLGQAKAKLAYNGGPVDLNSG
jgi:hypothetical protein